MDKQKAIEAFRIIDELVGKAEGLTVKEALKLASSLNAIGAFIEKADIKATLEA